MIRPVTYKQQQELVEAWVQETLEAFDGTSGIEKLEDMERDLAQRLLSWLDVRGYNLYERDHVRGLEHSAEIVEKRGGEILEELKTSRSEIQTVLDRMDGRIRRCTI